MRFPGYAAIPENSTFQPFAKPRTGSQTKARMDGIDVGSRHTAKNRLANSGQMVCGVSGGPVGLASIFIKNGT